MEEHGLKVKPQPGFWIFFGVIGLLLAVCVVLTIGALSEKPPSHPMDFQNVSKKPLKQEINSVKDGMPYAIEEALNWRQDAVLTGIMIVSNGKDEIQAKTGKVSYEFQFPYINEENPSGIISVTIDMISDSIELVSASHDVRKYSGNLEEEVLVVTDAEIYNTYDDIIKKFGVDEINKYKYQLIRFEIDSRKVSFTIKLSDNGKDYIRQDFEVKRAKSANISSIN